MWGTKNEDNTPFVLKFFANRMAHHDEGGEENNGTIGIFVCEQKVEDNELRTGVQVHAEHWRSKQASQWSE